MAKKKEKILKKRSLFHKIVNVFLYMGIIILIIFLLAFGFSQTSTFRDYLRQNIVNLANKELNGHLSIEKIDGTIFTSLFLRNTVVNMGADTLLNAGLIEVKTSPLQIFLKRIYVRKILISDTRIALTSDSDGKLNIAKLFPPAAEDTSHSTFQFKIIAPDVELNKVDFSLQDYNHTKSNAVYNNLNMHDFRVKDLNLSLSALADIYHNNYELKINNFSFNPNIKNFRLKDFSGEFLADTNGIVIHDLSLATDTTKLLLSGAINNFNLFSSKTKSNIEKAKLNVNLKAEKFNFADLSSFVPATDILHGTASVNLEAAGSFSELVLNRLNVNLLNSHLQSDGVIKNLIEPNRINISAKFNNSYVDPVDINNLLPTIGLSAYNNLGTIQIDTLGFDGSPLNFNSKLFIKIKNGSLYAKTSLNLMDKIPSYTANLKTSSLDLSPFIGVETNLTSKCSIKGSGFSPQILNTSVKLLADGSTVGGNKIDSLRFNANAVNKNIAFDLKLSSDTTKADLDGSFDFKNPNKPAYDLKGFVRNLNLADFTHDSTMESRLNFKVNGSGDDFDLDKTNLYLSMELDKSIIKGVNINKARAIFDIRSNDNGERIINIISDLADFTIIGNYSIKHAISLFVDEAGLLTSAFKTKIYNIMNPDSVFNKQLTTGIAVPENNYFANSQIDSTSFFKYSIEFKNFDLLSLLLGSNQLSLDGDMNGEVKTTASGVSISSNTNLNYIKYWSGGNVFFLSNFNLGLNISNGYNASSLADINTNIKLTADRIFEGGDFKNTSFNLNLTNNIAHINFGSELNDKISANLDGQINLTDNTVKLNLDTLNFTYNKFALVNKGNVQIDYSKDSILVNNFKLVRNGGEFSIKGLLAQNAKQDLKIVLKNIHGNDLITNLLNMNPENGLDANLHLNGEITGDYENPLLNLSFGADSVKFKNKIFGSLVSNLNYRNQNLAVDVRFLDSLLYKNKPALQINGDVPIDLSFTGAQERFKKSSPIDLTLTAQDFDLGALGNIIPKISQLKGRLAANLQLGGTPSNLKTSGQILTKNLSFRVDANNLVYDAGIKLKIDNQQISIDSLILANVPGTKGGGVITGGGNVKLKNFEIASINAYVNGSLKVLSSESKAVSPNLYGDLVVQTNKQITYTMDPKGSFVNVPIIVKEAKLIFPPTQSSYQGSSDNFVYRYLVDSSKINKNELDFEKLVNISKKMNSENNEEAAEKKSKLSYSVNIKVQNEAMIQFVLSREFNQNLTAILQGNLQYDNLNGRTNAQGELNLLDGSTLEFFKTFDAAGTIRFESQINNPNLNILATYKNYYTPPDQEGKDEPVAVTIKLSGPLKDLSKNFNQGKNNINVYVGADEIANNKPDPTKDVTDAVMFILFNKFSSDLSAQQSQSSGGSSGTLSNFTSSTTTSFAGSLIGGVLNHYFGDYVRGVELRSVGSTTKFNLVGKVKDFRYSIGGSTNVFQDFSQANVKIEYPILKNFLFRLERKEAVTQTNISNEMTNEIGLKYRFEF